MKELFFQTVNLSLTGTYVMAIVYLVRFCLKRAPKGISYGLWSVVLFRLLCPFSLSVGFSLLRRVGQSNPVNGTLGNGVSTFAMSGSFVPVVQAGVASAVTQHVEPSAVLPSAAQPLAEMGQNATGMAGVNWMSVLETALPILWLAGVAAVLLYGLFSALQVRKRVKTATLLRGSIYETDQFQTPFVFGLFRPKIYLPLGLLPKEQRYILLHEQIHIRRHDPLVKCIGFLALAIHWFNPGVWLMFHLLSKDMELSCDERVLKELGEGVRAAYSASLLSLAMRQSKLIGPLAFGENHTKERVKSVMKYRKSNRLATGLAILLAAGILTACASNPTIGADASPTSTLDAKSNASLLAQGLYAGKTDYIGNASKVQALVNLLPPLAGSRQTTISMTTAEKPYGLCISYESLDDAVEVKEEAFFQNAALLFATIQNVDEIQFTCPWSTHLERSSMRFSHTVTREEVDRGMGSDVRDFAESPEQLDQLITKLEALGPIMIYGSKNLEEAVSYAILHQNASGYLEGECSGEGHSILSTEEKDGTTVVYAIASYSEFGFQNGVFTAVSGSGAIPTVMTFVKNAEGAYACVNYQIPLDGAYYLSSLEEMFPKDLLNKAKNAQSYYEALVVQKEAYAAAYLQRIGREAKVQDVLDDLVLPDMSTEASNLLLEIYWDYPYWIGTEEKIENGVRYIYEKKWESAGNGDGVVAFEKRKEEGTIVEYVEIVVKDDHMTCKAGTPRSGLGQS